MADTKLIEAIRDATARAGQIGENDRKELLDAIEKFQLELENPIEATQRICFSPVTAVAVRLGVDMSLFDAAASAPDGRITLEHLATKTGHDTLLIRRVMRTLAASGVFTEKARNTFAATKLSQAYVTGSPLTAVILHLTMVNTFLDRLHEYFEAKGSPYKNPDDTYDCPFQFARNTKQHAWDWVAERPRQHHAFNIVMGLRSSVEKYHWWDFVPVEETLSVSNPDELALVDIGGNLGHDLVAMKKAHPNIRGKLILVDLPAVIATVNGLPSGIEPVAHDMFEPLPESLRGAKAYMLRNVLHDWPDSRCLTILRNIHDAMGPESRLLVGEVLMQEEKVHLFTCATDLTMMAAFAAMDRTEAQFRDLFQRAGFETTELWHPQNVSAEDAFVFEAKKVFS